MTWGELKKQAKALGVKNDAEIRLGVFGVKAVSNFAEKITYVDDGPERGGAELIISNA